MEANQINKKSIGKPLPATPKPPQHHKIIGGLAKPDADQEAKKIFGSPSTGKPKPQSVVQQKLASISIKQAKIKISIEEERIHLNHPVNRCIRLINTFCIEAFLKQNQSYFFPASMSKGPSKQNRANATQQNFNPASSQLSPSAVMAVDHSLV